MLAIAETQIHLQNDKLEYVHQDTDMSIDWSGEKVVKNNSVN